MQQSDLNTTIMSLKFQIDGMQKDLIVAREQLKQFEKEYVSNRENDFQLQAIRASIQRMEIEKDAMQKIVGQLELKLRDQDASARERDALQREVLTKLIKDQGDELNEKLNALSKTIDKLVIRVLWFIVSAALSIVATVVASLVFFYITNFHH